MRKILLADNQDITCLGLKYLIQTSAISNNIQAVSTKLQLKENLQNAQSALVLLDFNLFDFESYTELLALSKQYPEVDWLLFSDAIGEEFLINVLYQSNAIGVVLKDAGHEEILTALKEAIRGRRYICNFVSNLLLDANKRDKRSTSQVVKLTLTEKEILHEMALGKTTKEIANVRFVSIHTIMTHRKNIFKKIKVNNVHEATKYAMRAGIVEMAEYYI